MSFSTTLSDPDFKVAAFSKSDVLVPTGSMSDMGPDIGLRTGLSSPSLTSAYTRLADLPASTEILECFNLGLVKNTLCTMRTLPIPIDSYSTVKEPHGMCQTIPNFLASLQLRMKKRSDRRKHTLRAR